MKLSIFLLAMASAAWGAAAEHWVATWGASQQLYRAPVNANGRGPAPALAPAPAARPNGPARRFPVPPPLAGLHNQTVRMVAKTSLAGSTVRIRLQNALGAPTVRIGAAHIALRSKGSAIDPATDRTLTFSGEGSAPLYGGATLVSDPVKLSLPPLADVAVSLFLPEDTGAPANHLFALHTTWISKEGDQTGAPEITDGETRESYYWLAGIDVMAPATAATLVTFGDSITDGDQSTNEMNSMWPAVLAARLQKNKSTASIAVVNAGISGNRVLGDNQSALARLEHDVMSHPGVRWITVLEGINDITGGSRGLPGAPPIKPDMLIAAYRQIINTAHARGVKVIGCTLTPYGGATPFNEYGESVRSAVNQWIRTGGAFDAVIDFDAAVRDSNDPTRMRPEVDSPDMLHPGDAGYKLMGEAVDLRIFRR
jgi:lysophospholipase L1-like esterase